MASHHEHHHDDTYFLDQICMVALSGTFGVMCLCLYFLQQGMLFRLLGAQFHPFVLASGVALLVIAVVRAGMLWSMTGAKMHADELADNHAADAHEHSHSHADCGHDHSHGHEHSHSHGNVGHEHAHSQAELGQSRAFGHTPSPTPAPSHAHSHEDHDHGWAPWRYVVLLVPIILFLLGLPSKGPSINAADIAKIDSHDEAVFAVTLAAMSGDNTGALAVFGARQAESAAGEAQPVDVKRLESMAGNADDRDFWKGKTIRVRGQYAPQSDRIFALVRFRIQCCAGDAIQLSIPVIAKESITNIKAQGWAEVIGRVDFRQIQHGFKTVVLVSGSKHVQPCNPDLNPYLQ